MFAIIGTVDTGDIQIGSFIWITVLIDGKPVGMRLIKIFVGAVGVHAGEHRQPVGMGCVAEVPEQIALSQVFGLAVQGDLCWIIGDDTPGVGDDAAGAGASPVITPPGNIVLLRVLLCDVDLSPAGDGAVPGGGWGGRLGCAPGSDGRQASSQQPGGCGGLLYKIAAIVHKIVVFVKILRMAIFGAD